MRKGLMVLAVCFLLPAAVYAYDVTQWEIGGYGGAHWMEKHNTFRAFTKDQTYVIYGGKVKYNFNETWAAQLDLEGGSQNYSGAAQLTAAELAGYGATGVAGWPTQIYNMKLNYSTFNWELGGSYNYDGIFGGMFLRNMGFRGHAGLGFGGYNSSGEIQIDTDTVNAINLSTYSLDPKNLDGFNLKSNIGGKVFWGTEYFFNDEVSLNFESKYIFGASPISNGFSTRGGLTYHFNM